MKVIESVPVKKWLEILEGKTEYSFFQTPDFSSIICKHIKNYEEAHRLFIFDDGTEVLLPMVKIQHFSVKLGKYSKDIAYNLVSLPLGAPGGLISMNTISSGKLKEISDYLISINTMGVMIINHPKSNIILGEKFKIEELKTLAIPLDYAYEDMWVNRFDSKLRAEIKRAKKEDVVVKETKEEGILEKYLKLTEQLMSCWAKRIRLPINMIRDLICHQDSRLWIALVNDELAAGVLVLCAPNEMYYFQSAMDKSYSRFYPAKYIFEFIIKCGIKEGYKMLNLGSSGGIKSVEHFKMSFNPDTLTFYTQLYTTKFWNKVRKFGKYIRGS